MPHPYENLRQGIDVGIQLGDQTTLADPGLSHDRHELHRRAGNRLLERTTQDPEIDLASHEWGLVPPEQLRTETRARGLRVEETDRLGLTFEFGGRKLHEVEDVSRRFVRPLAHRDTVDWRDALQPRRRVHHVACDETLAEFWASIERDDPLAGVDPDADVKVYTLALGVEVSDRIEDPQAGADCALGVVLVCDGRPEHGHDGVADELLDGAAVALDLDPE